MQKLKLKMPIRALATMALLVLVTEGNGLVAQTVQLPVFRTFGVRTTVSVPDGGTINIGGGGGASFGQSSQSAFGRLPSRNRVGRRAPSRSSLSANIIRFKEFEQQMLADQAAKRLPPGPEEVNGSHAVQAQADFISRHVGR